MKGNCLYLPGYRDGSKNVQSFPLSPILAANQLTIIIVVEICNNSQSIKKQNN